MILVDANLLIYAVNQDSSQHVAAKRWLEKALSNTQVFGLPWIVVLAFLRITTHPKIFEKPLTPENAISYIDRWLNQPCTRLIVPRKNHWQVLRQLLLSSGTAGNLTSDAHIAALAIEGGYTIYSADYDFRRFSGLRHVNPLVT